MEKMLSWTIPRGGRGVGKSLMHTTQFIFRLWKSGYPFYCAHPTGRRPQAAGDFGGQIVVFDDVSDVSCCALRALRARLFFGGEMWMWVGGRRRRHCNRVAKGAA